MALPGSGRLRAELRPDVALDVGIFVLRTRLTLFRGRLVLGLARTHVSLYLGLRRSGLSLLVRH